MSATCCRRAAPSSPRPTTSGRGHLPGPDLEPDPVGPGRACGKAALRDETFELNGGVGAVPEPGQDPPRDEAVQDAELLPLHLLVDLGGRSIPAHVLDHRQPTRAKN